MLGTPLWFTVAVWTFVLAAAPSKAQCDDDQLDDVVFEITIDYYDTDPFGWGRFNVTTYGPALGSLSAPDRNFGTFPEMQFSSASASALGGSLSFDLRNLAEVTARRPDGHLFGQGITLWVAAYIEGPTGTPYFIHESGQGQLQANFPQGLGRADSCFVSTCASSVNGSGLDEADVDYFTSHIGVTSGERTINGKTYSLAGTFPYDLRGGIWQSIDFCFPFAPCDPMRYVVDGRVTGAIHAGIGHPTCQLRRLTVDTSGAVLVDGGCGTGCKNLEAPFLVTVDVAGNCECCEYRQYVREVARYVDRGFVANGLIWAFRPRPKNHRGEDMKQCLVEDTADATNPGCSSGYVAQGERAEPESNPREPRDNGCRTPGYDEYLDDGGNPARLDGCRYLGYDAPTMGPIKPGHSYKTHLVFEARVIAVAREGCLPGSEDTVVGRRRFSVCYEGILGTSGPTSCSESFPDGWPDWVQQEFTIGGVTAELYVWVSRDGLLAGTVVITPEAGQIIGDGDVLIDILNHTQIPASDGIDISFVESAGGDAITYYKDFVIELPPCEPSLTVALNVQGAGDTRVVDISSLQPTCHCPGDITGSSDPSSPGYGTPDGVVDASDFFYFLDQFVAGNVAAADLTSSSDPTHPTYGVPDGFVDASDFFYYLDLFAAGCP